MTWDRPNIRMVDNFGRGRVFIAGGETTAYLSLRSLIYPFQMQLSVYTNLSI